jgi:hypothetical protein
MPVSRKLLAHDNNQDAQWLKIDHSSRYIENHNEEWQFIFNVDSQLTNSTQVIKIAAEFDTSDLNSIRLIGYLYNTVSGTADSASSCTFKIYRVENINSPKWNDLLVHTVSGSLEPNNYFYADVNLNQITGANLDGDTTLAIECLITRLGAQYADKIYVNHLGVYGSVLQLRQEVEFLDLTKLDE